MKEHVVIINGYKGISNNFSERVNSYLDDGWTVKTVTISSEREHTTAIFVLQRGY